MASTYSALKVELIGTGEQSGTWGTTTNTNLGTALEEAITGRATANFTTDADLTLGYTDSNATQTFRNLILNVTSVSLSATRNLIVPTIEKQYLVENNTTGGQSIVVKTTAGTGITIPNGKKAHVYADGTNVVQASDFFPTIDINGGTIDGATIGASTAGAATFTNLTASGTVNFSGATVSNGGTVTTVDINGGTIDGSTIGGATPAAGTFTTATATTGNITTVNATTVNTTTLDLTNLEVTNIKAKDGTAAATIADSTGKITVSTELAVDNLNLSGNAITSTNANGNIDLTPSGTGEVNITKVDIDSGTIDGATIGANSAAAGTFTNLTATTGVNFSGATVSNGGTVTTVDINGGTIDNTAIGGSTASTGAFTTLSASSTLSVTGAGTIQGLTVGRGAGAVATNTAVGASALAGNTSTPTGTNNLAVGYQAGYNITSGGYQTAVGASALKTVTTGTENTAVGYGALEFNTTGSYNVAQGLYALRFNTTASNNTAVGYQAGYSNTTGTNNTALGIGALYSNGTTSGNTAVGAGTLAFTTSGTNNTAVGYNAGNLLTTGSKNTILGAYNGNQDGLDIRTANNYIVLSDGDGNPRLHHNGTAWLNLTGRRSNAHTMGNVQQWVGSVTISTNGGTANLFTINQIYENLCGVIYVDVNRNGQIHTAYVIFTIGYNGFTTQGYGTGWIGNDFNLSRTGTLYNETLTITNNSGNPPGSYNISVEVWGRSVTSTVATGGNNLITSSYLTRIE